MTSPATQQLPSWFAQAQLIFRKDLRIELRTGEVVVTGGFFAVLVTVISSLAYYAGPGTSHQVAAGVIWLATAFAAVLALGRSWQHERDAGALDALLVSPVAPGAVFLGKALGVGLFLCAIECVVVVLCALFFNVDVIETAPSLALLCAAATPGVAASGTLFGVMTVRTKARDLVLSIVLFPLLSPTLLAAVVATRELFDGAPLVELLDYFKIMLLFDSLFIVGGVGLFGTLAER